MVSHLFRGVREIRAFRLEILSDLGKLQREGALEWPMGDLVNPVIKSPAVGGPVEEIQIVRRDKDLRIIQEIHSCGATEYSLHAPGIQIHHLLCNRLVRKAD